MRLSLVLIVGATACGPTPSAAPVATPPPPAPVASPPRPPPTAPPPISPGSVSVGEIVGPATFDPKATLTAMKPAMLECFAAARALNPDLHGKLTLTIRLNERGSVSETDAQPGGSANDPGLVACIADAMTRAAFPRPGGLATVTVPLVFRQ